MYKVHCNFCGTETDAKISDRSLVEEGEVWVYVRACEKENYLAVVHLCNPCLIQLLYTMIQKLSEQKPEKATKGKKEGRAWGKVR